jgi:hypothetical protein
MDIQNTSNNSLLIRPELQEIETKFHEKNLFEELIEEVDC